MEKNDVLVQRIDDFLPQAVVIDAGVFPSNMFALQWLHNCSKIVCCDGAANDFIRHGGHPWRIVGDCDSLNEDIKTRYAEIIRRIPEQESNDQTKAVRYLSCHGVSRIAILGATGLREDHTIGNVSLLIDYLKHGIEARIYSDYGVFLPVHDHVAFSCPAGTQVSIFNFSARGLTSCGLRYQLRDFDNWWQGTLNETISDPFEINAEGYFLLFVNYPKVSKENH